MKKHTAHLLSSAISTALLMAPAVQAAPTLTEALQQGSSVKVNFRTRYEDVSWDGYEDSDALTLRSRLTYQSGAWQGFATTLEMDDVTAIDHNVDYKTWPKDPVNSKSAPIFDPEGTEVNQAVISYTTFNNAIKYGRQRIVLDNSRFIGNVGWRQNEQTYDGLSFTNKTIRYTNIYVAHITNVNRIFGDGIEIQGDYHQDSNLVNVSYTGFTAGKLVGYAYLIDNINDAPLYKIGAIKAAGALSSNTYGVRWASTANTAFMYTLEYAKQSGAYENPLEYTTDYMFAEMSTTLGRFVPALGYEVLGSDEGKKGFATPFATLHAFNGWADRFLNTPVNGLKDMYVNVTATTMGAQFLVSYHDFKSAVNDIDYGTEWNLSISKKFGAVAYTIKYAMFENSGTWKEPAPTATSTPIVSDTTKFWLQADWNF
jgi:hypothetical protein